MGFDSTASYLIAALLLPPGVNLLLLAIGFTALRKFRRTSASLIFFGGVSLLALSMPLVSESLARFIETEDPLTAARLKQLQVSYTATEIDTAIVVLSAGRQSLAPEHGEIDTVNAATLERLNYARRLVEKTGLPVLLTGGSLHHDATSEAVLMNRTMLTSFGVAPRWIESAGGDTMESAQYSSAILKQNQIRRVLLVTHAWNSVRAKLAFEKQGLEVISAPIAFTRSNVRTHGVAKYLPRAQALFQSSLAFQEMLGLFWYQIRY